MRKPHFIKVWQWNRYALPSKKSSVRFAHRFFCLRFVGFSYDSWLIVLFVLYWIRSCMKICFLFESISSSIIRHWLVSLYLFSRYNLIQISPSHAMLPKHVPRFIIHFLVLFLASTSLILESVLFFLLCWWSFLLQCFYFVKAIIVKVCNWIYDPGFRAQRSYCNQVEQVSWGFT